MVSWSWDFGDTNTSTLQNPSHTYTSAGNYTVSLTATGPGGAELHAQVGRLRRELVRAEPAPRAHERRPSAGAKLEAISALSSRPCK